MMTDEQIATYAQELANRGEAVIARWKATGSTDTKDLEKEMRDEIERIFAEKN